MTVIGRGSTISQQLAKNMFGRKRTRILTLLITKTKEAILAHRLENHSAKKKF